MSDDDDIDLNDVINGELVVSDRQQCVSIAWHGDRCKNAAQPGKETCKWHDHEYVKRAEDRFAPTDDPTKWHVRCKAPVMTPDKDGTPADRQCGKNAVRGLDVCGTHGGSHPAAKEMGAKVMEDRVRQHRLKELAEKHGFENIEEINPLLEMQKLAVETIRMKDFLFEQVTELDNLVYTDRLGIENVRQVMQAYERAMERTSRLLADMGKLDIDNRLVKITERQGDLVANILEKVLSRLDLEEERRQEAQTYLSEEFRRLEAAS